MRRRTVHEVAFRLSHDMATQIAPEIEKFELGLTKQQMRAIRLIWASDQVTLVDVAKTLKRNKAQVVRLVDELCKAGMVVREPNPNDGRSKILTLTDKASNFFKSVEETEAKFSAELTVGISRAELDVFYSVADRLSENLRDLNK